MNRRHFLKGTGAAGFVLSTGVSAALPGAGTPDSPGQAASPGMNFIKHDYDPVSDQSVFRVLDRQHPSLGQSFTVPEGAAQISGFRMKVRRLGEAPDLRFRIGHRYGADDIATGVVKAEDVNPFFEFFLGSEFPPRSCAGGQKYFLQLSLEGPATGVEGYQVYGTTTEGETPSNQDYGAKTPDYAGGEAWDSEGQSIADVDFAFEVFFAPGGFAQSHGEGEPRFSFVKDLLRGPHAQRIKPSPAHPRPGEFVLDETWQVVAVRSMGGVAATSVADFREYLDVAAGVKIQLQLAEPGALENHHKAVIVGLREQMPRYGAGLERSESFHLEAGDNSVIVCGFDERGIMRGLYYLQDLMDLRGGPILSRESTTRHPRLTPRITCAPFFTNQVLDAPIDPYTDGLLSLISHQGFNAIWIIGSIHDLGQSRIYPELGQAAPLKLARLDTIIQRAGKYGIDVYVYLEKYGLPPEFFEKHPEVKGSSWPPGWGGSRGFLMCTSIPKARTYLEEATASIFQHAPGLKGIIFIFGNEGFGHDWMPPHMDCARCQNRSPFDVVNELIATLDRGAKTGRTDAQVVAWPYSGGQWTAGDPDQIEIIAQLPKDVIFLNNFETTYYSQLGVLRDGVGANIYDYSISNLGPSERYQQQARAAAERNIGLWAKTESNYALEFIQTPYIPVLQRWHERFQRITAIPHISGAFMQWNHYGFMPSPCAEIAKWYTWEPQPEVNTLLQAIATRDFGEAAGPKVVDAWSHFSQAFSFYPFSGGTAFGPIQKGPAHPLFLDPAYKPENSSGRNFTNSLLWTMPFGAEIAAKYFRLLQEGWQRGVDLLEKAARDVPPEKKRNLEREMGVAKVLLSCMNSVLNVISFCQLRFELSSVSTQEGAQHILDRMAQTAQRELENSQQALVYVNADSRLGYAQTGDTSGVGRGGIFSPQSIEKKIRSVRRLLETEIPASRAKLGVA